MGPNKPGDLDLEQKWLQDMSQLIERIQKQVNKVAEKVYSNELKTEVGTAALLSNAATRAAVFFPPTVLRRSSDQRICEDN